jgi:hypothetical protein
MRSKSSIFSRQTEQFLSLVRFLGHKLKLLFDDCRVQIHLPFFKLVPQSSNSLLETDIVLTGHWTERQCTLEFQSKIKE